MSHSNILDQCDTFLGILLNQNLFKVFKWVYYWDYQPLNCEVLQINAAIAVFLQVVTGPT